MSASNSWVFWALLSAVFAALTAIFAKVGVENINPDFATFVRTIVVIVALFGVTFLGEKLSATHWLGVALIALGAVSIAA